MSDPIRVVVVDDHAIVRQGLEQLLSTAPDLELVGTAADGDEAVRVVTELVPDVVLMDLSMPRMDGVEATRRLADGPSRIVVLTSFGDARHVSEALDAGAIGYLLKHADPDEILGAVRAAAAGDSPLDPKVARVLLLDRRAPAARAHQLSAREQEVLQAVVAGMSNKQVARRLGITERTVKAHLTSVFAKIGVTDRTQAALWAERNLGSPTGA